MTTSNRHPRGPWVHLFSSTGCDHGCRTIERHGAIVGRTVDSITVQLFDWDIIDGRVPRPIPGAVLRLAPDELAVHGAAVYSTYADAHLAETEAVAQGLGQCGHLDVPPASVERPHEPTAAERARDADLADLGVLSPRELTREMLGWDGRA